jgi:hypothetical protein
LEYWLDDYRQVAPGRWFPMTQGYAFYDQDKSGQNYIRSRRDMKIVEIRINEPLPDEMFHIDLKEGVEVQDLRGQEFRSDIYVTEPSSLLGRPIPDFNDITFDRELGEINDRPLVICFCDRNQRPSRHCLRQLSAKTDYLSEQGIVVLVIQAEKSDEPIADVDQRFATGRISHNHQQVRFTWGVQSLPWLILTDQNHVVRAEGFHIDEIDGILTRMAEAQKQRIH